MNRVLATLLSATLTCAVACGGAQPEPQAPETETQTTSQRVRPRGPGMQVSTELGSLDERATALTFQRLQGKLYGCYKSGLKRIEYLAGDVKIFLRVAQDGSVKYGYLEDSTLGDRETEKCMMDVLTASSWPKPDGGEAEARNVFHFDGPGDVRPPASWGADRLADSLARGADSVHKCKEGLTGHFHATAYVEPDGKQGKIQSVGITPPNKDGVEKLDCLIEAIKEMKPPSPGSYAAKVSFDL